MGDATRLPDHVCLSGSQLICDQHDPSLALAGNWVCCRGQSGIRAYHPLHGGVVR